MAGLAFDEWNLEERREVIREGRPLVASLPLFVFVFDGSKLTFFVFFSCHIIFYSTKLFTILINSHICSLIISNHPMILNNHWMIWAFMLCLSVGEVRWMNGWDGLGRDGWHKG